MSYSSDFDSLIALGADSAICRDVVEGARLLRLEAVAIGEPDSVAGLSDRALVAAYVLDVWGVPLRD